MALLSSTAAAPQWLAPTTMPSTTAAMAPQGPLPLPPAPTTTTAPAAPAVSAAPTLSTTPTSPSTSMMNLRGGDTSWKGVLEARPLVAIATGLVIALLLVMWSPPLVQARAGNGIEEPTLSPLRVAVISGLAAIAVFLGPFVRALLCR